MFLRMRSIAVAKCIGDSLSNLLFALALHLEDVGSTVFRNACSTSLHGVTNVQVRELNIYRRENLAALE